MKEAPRTVGFVLMALAFYGGLGLLNTLDSNGLGFCAGGAAKILPGC